MFTLSLTSDAPPDRPCVVWTDIDPARDGLDCFGTVRAVRALLPEIQLVIRGLPTDGAVLLFTRSNAAPLGVAAVRVGDGWACLCRLAGDELFLNLAPDARSGLRIQNAPGVAALIAEAVTATLGPSPVEHWTMALAALFPGSN